MNVPSTKIVFSEEDKEEILFRIKEVLSNGQLTLGKYGKEFEEIFSKYVGAKYAITVNSGTSSLEIPLRCLGIKDYSVIVPTNTFAATAFAVHHAGGKIQFADCGSDYCLNPESLLKHIRPDTKAVILVHIGGNIGENVSEIRKICEEKRIHLIEDAAHAHGSSFEDRMAGTFGIANSFSFYPTKVMTSGEGGMIVTDNEELYKRALQLRDQGKKEFYSNEIVCMGNNWRMGEINAIIGLQQLKRLEKFLEDRRKIAAIYDRRLEEIDKITPLKIPKNSKSNYYKYIAILQHGIDRIKLKKDLKEKFNISLSGEVYDTPLHLQPIFKQICGTKEGDFPIAEDLCSRQICLPIFATMTEEQANYVIDSLKELLK